MINFPKSAYKNKTFSEMLAYAPHLFYIFSFFIGLADGIFLPCIRVYNNVWKEKFGLIGFL